MKPHLPDLSEFDRVKSRICPKYVKIGTELTIMLMLYSYMQRHLKLYFLLAGYYVRSRFQYRLSFALRCVTIAVSEACLVGLLGVLFTKFRAVNGWTLAEVVFLYGLGNLAYSLMRIVASQLDDFDRYILQGDLDTVLTKPLPPLFYVLASRVELHHVARALTSVVIFILALNFAQIRWSTFFLDDSSERRRPVFCVVRISNVFNNPGPEGRPRWVAYPRPQAIFQYYDGLTGELLYAESILATGAS